MLSRYSRLVRRSKSKVVHVPTKCVSPAVVIITIQAPAVLRFVPRTRVFYPGQSSQYIHPRRKRKTGDYAFTSVVYKRRFFLSIFTTVACSKSAVDEHRSHAQKSYILLFFRWTFPPRSVKTKRNRSKIKMFSVSDSVTYTVRDVRQQYSAG